MLTKLFIMIVGNQRTPKTKEETKRTDQLKSTHAALLETLELMERAADEGNQFAKQYTYNRLQILKACFYRELSEYADFLNR